MESGKSWISHPMDHAQSDAQEIDDRGNTDEASGVSINAVLPDDLLERILTYLPVASIREAGLVCKKWHEIVSSELFLRSLSQGPSQKPWYFMFCDCDDYDDPTGYAYDPAFRKWHRIDLPCLEATGCSDIASSRGLVSIMHHEYRRGWKLFVCNPITRSWRRIELQQRVELCSGSSALAISVSKTTQSYKILIVQSEQVPGDLPRCDVSIHVYDSKKTTWSTLITEVLTGWTGIDGCAICDGVLYFLIGAPKHRYGLLMYNLSQRSTDGLLASFIPVPCPLRHACLMNMKEKLVLVGGIQGTARLIKGIGIWVLNGRKWQQISRLPRKFSRMLLRDRDYVFASSGSNELIYIHNYEFPALVVFDMNRRLWKWSENCPVTMNCTLPRFTGFCFEPRLEIAP